jgi:hypothetical protein
VKQFVKHLENIVKDNKLHPASETDSFLEDRASFRAAGKEIANCLLECLTKEEVNEIQGKLIASTARLSRSQGHKGTRAIVWSVCEGINEVLSKRHIPEIDLKFKTDTAEDQAPPAL